MSVRKQKRVVQSLSVKSRLKSNSAFLFFSALLSAGLNKTFFFASTMKAFVLICAFAAAWALPEPVEKSCTDKPETGPCLAYFPMFYYDPESGTCLSFVYGGCKGNGNRYATQESCMKNCAKVSQRALDRPDCDKAPEQGVCDAYMPRYYYDQEDGMCKTFVYGGCGGNRNNFRTEEECYNKCGVSQRALDRPDCDKAPEQGMCEAYMPRYYYDQEAGMCKMFIYGGCGGNRNNFGTEEECYNKCGALRTDSACEQEKVVGPCRGRFPRYYYNKETGQCELFFYGGCGGNDNNFQRKEVCEAICVVSAVPRSPSKCNLQPETGRCKGRFQRFYYDPESKTCKKFIYGGCGGNENNFETEGECLDVCSE